jgi:hypothetical protein
MTVNNECKTFYRAAVSRMSHTECERLQGLSRLPALVSFYARNLVVGGSSFELRMGV